jgi:putative ABC transport system substrate-binding protein
MKRLYLTVFFVVACYGLASAGQEIAVVQSAELQPYAQAVEGFARVCNASLQKMVITESRRGDILREIKLNRPDMILAIGKDALSLVKSIETIPIVYLMVLDPQSTISGQENITGVSMTIPPDRQLRALRQTLPHAKNVGLLYDPERTGYLVEEAQRAAGEMGMVLMAKEVHSPKDVAPSAMDMRGKIDAFWMLPDVTVMTPETVEFLLLYSLKHRIPLLAFSERYLDLGAFLSTGIDAFDMGAQAGEMANKILLGKQARDIQQAHARKYVVSTNLMIAGKLGIPVNLAMTSGSDEKIIRTALTVQ